MRGDERREKEKGESRVDGCRDGQMRESRDGGRKKIWRPKNIDDVARAVCTGAVTGKEGANKAKRRIGKGAQTQRE